MHKRTLLKTMLAGAAAVALPYPALSQSRPLKIGLVTDYSGVYADISGAGDEYSVRMAIEDFKHTVLGRPIELLTADHQNKADIASGTARRWIDADKVDMLMPGGSSAAALAVQLLARDRGIMTNISASGASSFTEQDCSPVGFHWLMDTYAMPRASIQASGAGNKKWFLLVVDYVTGHTTAAAAAAAIKEAGGQVVGSVKHPLNTTDFASYIAQAQSSRADVIAVISFGSDLTRVIKQAREFGVQKSGQVLVAPFATTPDIISLGLDVAQGLRLADGYYWDLNDATRAFAKRFQAKIGRPPSAAQATSYAAITHYLQAVEAVKTTEPSAVAARMRAQPVTSGFFSNVSIRPNGRVIYDLNLIRVKSPSESKSKFDIFEVTGTVAGDKVFKPLALSECKSAK